jgi:hypothetical protein
MTNPIDSQYPEPTPAALTKLEFDYQQEAAVFQKALKKYTQSSDPVQREAFHKVMDQAMQVLNDTAAKMVHTLAATMENLLDKPAKAILDSYTKTLKDYTAFNKKPEDSLALKHLNDDLSYVRSVNIKPTLPKGPGNSGPPEPPGPPPRIWDGPVTRG